MEQASLTTAFVRVDDSSRVAECRRVAIQMARREGLSEQQSANAAIVASELATNMAKYAQGGALQIATLSERWRSGVELMALDRGPGMASVSACMADGFSTGASAGSGLGAVRRLSNYFDIHSIPGRGTVVVSQIYGDGASPLPAFRLGITTRAVAGEPVCGDTWGVRHAGRWTMLMVADGLGHGVLASEAATAALTAFHRSKDDSTVGVAKAMHGALRGTRGAAIAVARVEFEAGVVQFTGLGNIAGVVISQEGTHNMISHYGTAGHEAPHVREFQYPWTKNSVIVMHSDGVSGSWNPDAYPGFSRMHEALISALLYRDCGRDRDDACVIVGRERERE